MHEPLEDALGRLSSALADEPAVATTLFSRWRTGVRPADGDLGPELWPAADVVDAALPAWSRAAVGRSEVGDTFERPSGEVIFIWCAASTSRTDARMAAILKTARDHPEYAEQALIVARNRVVEGPLEDALRCAPLLGSGDELGRRENGEARARREILLWEAGAAALQMPSLGRWIWASQETFDELIGVPARGSLRGRVLAARAFEVSLCGMPASTDPALVGRSLQVLQPLLLHPEPMVWIHAARSFGRLAGIFEPLEGTLLDWVHGASPVLRQRALTAFASLPAERLTFLGHELAAIVEQAPDEEAWLLAAGAASTPYLFHERRDLWDQLAQRIVRGDGGAVAARALARGLATLWRRGRDRAEIEGPFRQLREMARRIRTESVDDQRRWLEVIAVTDPIDGAERDPLDIELGLENLVRLAAQYDDEEADARAARFAGTLDNTFQEARRIVLGDGTLRHRAAEINALEGCARSLALRLWAPMLATRMDGDPIQEPDLEETWALAAGSPAEILEEVAERRRAGDVEEGFDLALEVLAIKLGGYALDACGEEPALGPGGGPTAHETCRWLRKLEGLADGSRSFPPPLRHALSSLFWRLVDTTRGTALGEVDDVEWLGPFAAWGALVVDRPALLRQLATALPMINEGALEACCTLADATRSALAARRENGAWGPEVASSLTELRAQGTELAAALAGLSSTIAAFAEARGGHPELDTLAFDLVVAAERLQGALADPVRGLHGADPAATDGEAARENASRMASVVTRAIRTREMSLLEVWFASLGPIASALVEEAVQGAVRRTPPPPPAPQKKEPKTIEGYELVKPLGEGGIGSVWLVRKPGADRLFVLKIPKADALSSATDTEREGILASFVDEAQALAGLYHPNVANIIDRGVADGVPYLVLEYLIGADLKKYSEARKMTLFELRGVVAETCAGLTALHNAGLVHRDIKPGNLFLRLPLDYGERFDPERHRDPARAQPLATVIIDFGMVRAMRVPPDVGGRFVAGTAGYIAPEQVLDPVELDGRADVYALAGTIYNVSTGRTFFDHIDNPRERIVAHMREDPMEDLSLFQQYPAGLIRLLRQATAHDVQDRPTPLEFGRAFEQLL
ncbi:MAG: protein kinase [Sandaracinaceae bacterium]